MARGPQGPLWDTPAGRPNSFSRLRMIDRPITEEEIARARARAEERVQAYKQGREKYPSRVTPSMVDEIARLNQRLAKVERRLARMARRLRRARRG